MNFLARRRERLFGSRYTIDLTVPPVILASRALLRPVDSEEDSDGDRISGPCGEPFPPKERRCRGGHAALFGSGSGDRGSRGDQICCVLVAKHKQKYSSREWVSWIGKHGQLWSFRPSHGVVGDWLDEGPR